MQGGVFICYRRDESAYAARAIHDRVVQRLDREDVFLDFDNIDLGVDWFNVLSERVGACDALVAVIGRNWTSTSDKDSQRRLDDPDDFVRIEIEAALKRDVRVIPVLVDGAVMPKAAELPDSLKGLARRQGIEVSPARFDADVEKLTRALASILEARRSRDVAEAEAARRADEDRRAREAAEAERGAREERERQDAAEVARVEEARRQAKAEAARQAEDERRAKETAEAELAAREKREAVEAALVEEARQKAKAEVARREKEERRAKEAVEAERTEHEKREMREPAEATGLAGETGRVADADTTRREPQRAEIVEGNIASLLSAWRDLRRLIVVAFCVIFTVVIMWFVVQRVPTTTATPAQQNEIGDRYYNVDRDFGKALDWYQRSADRG
ncbi:MAG TPA: TIR domain-containing protein, partial [Roseiarcus sp.]